MCYIYESILYNRDDAAKDSTRTGDGVSKQVSIRGCIRSYVFVLFVHMLGIRTSIVKFEFVFEFDLLYQHVQSLGL